MSKQTFTVGQVLTASEMTSLQQTAMGGGSATAKTASYTLVAADAGSTVIMNSASATTITVNTALFAAGDTVLIVNQGAGACTVTAGTATVNTAGSLELSQYETGQLYFLSTSAAIFSEYMQAASVSGGMTLLSTTTLSGASTSINITPTGYKTLQIFLTDVVSATNDVAVFTRLNGDTGNNYIYSGIRSDGTVSSVAQNAVSYAYYLFNTLPSTSNSLKNGQANITIWDPTGTDQHFFTWNSISMSNSGSHPNQVEGVATHNTGSAISSISFTPGSGNWSAGTVYIYGVK